MVRTLGQSMEKDILIAIHQLLSENRKPTVATVKSKLATSVSIPVIIKVLQKTSNMNANDVAQLLPDMTFSSIDNPPREQEQTVDISHQVATLKQELHRTQQELEELKQWVLMHLPKDKPL